MKSDLIYFFFVFKIRFLWASKDFSKDAIGQVELNISNFPQFIKNGFKKSIIELENRYRARLCG